MHASVPTAGPAPALLRVADASIMPAVSSGNTNAPSVMIGERGADFTAAERAGAD